MTWYELEFEITLHPKSGSYTSHGVGCIAAETPDGAILAFAAVMLEAFRSKPCVSNWRIAGCDWAYAQLVGGDFESGYKAELQWSVSFDTCKRRVATPRVDT